MLPYAVGADSISARAFGGCARPWRASNARPYEKIMPLFVQMARHKVPGGGFF